MIHTVILGAGSPEGGELIRILAMHPDIELSGAVEPALSGRKVSDIHHGLIGETDLNFTSEADWACADVALSCGGALSPAGVTELCENYPELKLILTGQQPDMETEEEGTVFGLPEMNRKSLVRGARVARVPHPFESMTLVALYPLALNMLLNAPVHIRVHAPAAVLKETNLDKVRRGICKRLEEAQPSFSNSVTIETVESVTRRSARMDITFDSTFTPDQLAGLYGIYDDHRFSFVTSFPTGVSEVAGTEKCMINVLDGEAGKAFLRVSADCRMRGSAGEAVHILNLMEGLHERTGLALKAIDFDKIEPAAGQEGR